MRWGRAQAAARAPDRSVGTHPLAFGARLVLPERPVSSWSSRLAMHCRDPILQQIHGSPAVDGPLLSLSAGAILPKADVALTRRGFSTLHTSTK